MATKTVAIRVPAEVHEAYKAAAKAQGTTLGKWIEGAAQAALDGGPVPVAEAPGPTPDPEPQAAPMPDATRMDRLPNGHCMLRHPLTGEIESTGSEEDVRAAAAKHFPGVGIMVVDVPAHGGKAKRGRK